MSDSIPVVTGATANVDLTIERDTFRLMPNAMDHEYIVGTVARVQPRVSAAAFGAVAGRVWTDSMAPLPGVTVAALGVRRAGRTDSVGEFRIDSVPAGLVRLAVARIGYRGTVRDSVSVVANATLGVDLLMHEDRLLPNIIQRVCGSDGCPAH